MDDGLKFRFPALSATVGEIELVHVPVNAPSAVPSYQRWLYGGLGALAPIAVSALAVDFVAFAANPLLSVILGWSIRILLLFLIGGFVVFLHKNLVDHWQCFVTGIAAPALITTAIAGKAIQPPSQVTEVFGFTTSAYAGGGGRDIQDLAQFVEIREVSDFSETFWEGFTRGLFGANRLFTFVVLDAVSQENSARKFAAAIQIYLSCNFDYNRTSVFLITSTRGDDLFVPLIAFSSPEDAVRFSANDELSFLQNKKRELVLSRQSDLGREIQSRFRSWQGRSRMDASDDIYEISRRYPLSCS